MSQYPSDAQSNPKTPKRDKLFTRWGQLKVERATWWSHWQEISSYLLPRSGRFFVQDRDKGWRRHNNIYDNTGTGLVSCDAAPEFVLLPCRIIDVGVGYYRMRPLGFQAGDESPDHPGKVKAGTFAGGLIVFDDYGTCTDWPTVAWQYRDYGATGWSHFAVRYFFQDTIWFDVDPGLAGTGPYEFRAVLTDCAGQSITTDIDWITLVDKDAALEE